MPGIEHEGAGERSRELLLALAHALRVLGSARDETTALSESFEHAARAFAAEKALLLRVTPGEPPEFEAVRSEGLAFEQVKALVTGRSIEGVSVYHAGTKLEAGQVVTAGGRVLGVTARGASLRDAHARAYHAVERIRFSGMQFRRDIGLRALAAGGA